MPGAVTLAAVLGARSAGLSEPEIWSLLCQAAQALQDLFLAKRARENAPRVSPASLRLTSRGRVALLPDASVPWPATDTSDRYLAPEYGGWPLHNTSEVDIEKMWIFSLGQSLREAVNADKVELTRPLDDLLTVMTRADPRQRATLMDVLNVISDFCKVRLDCKPFSHVAMDLYRETLDVSPPCLLVAASSGTPTRDADTKTVAWNGQVKLMISCNSQTKPAIVCNGHSRPVVTCNGHGSPAIACNGQGEPTVACNGHNRPTVTCNGHGSPTIACNGQGEPTVACNGHNRPTVTCNGQIKPTIACNGHGSLTIACNGQGEPTVACNGHDRLTIACNAQAKPTVGKSCSLKEPRAARPAPGLRRAPSHLYGAATTARYACPNTLIGPEFVVRASEPGRTVHFAGGKPAKRARGLTVVLLDGQRLDVRCDTGALTAGRLLEVVFQVQRIEENFFLGLAALLDGDLFFLCPDTRLCKVAARTAGCGLTLHLRVKFYLPSLRGVCRWASKHLLYLQLRRCLLEGQIGCEHSELLALGGLALQAEFGDAGEGGDYFLLEHYVPEGMLGAAGALIPALRDQHRGRRGLDPGRAEEMFVATAQSLETYGLHFYVATRVGRDDSRVAMWLAVGARGVAMYHKRGPDRELHRLYAWRDIDRLCYSKRYFVLHPRSDVKGVIPVKYKFQLDQNKCLFVFYLASQHHQFFLKLRTELSSLQSLSREFGVSLTNLGKKNRKLFYVENHRPPEDPPFHAVRRLVPSARHCSQTSLSGVGSASLDTSINIEEHQNKENEQPAFRRLNTDLVIINDSLECKEQRTQCLPCSLQYPGCAEPDHVRRTNSASSFPRRHRVKMGTRAISSVPKELSASQDTHTSLSSACSYGLSPSSPPRVHSPHDTRSPPSPPCSPHLEAYVLNSPHDAPPLPRLPPPLDYSPYDAPPLPRSAPPLDHSLYDAPPLPLSPPPVDHSPHGAPPLPLSPPPLDHSLYDAPPLLCSPPLLDHSPHAAPPLPLSPPPLDPSPTPEAYVLDSSIRSSDETFRLDVNESLSDSLADRFDEMSFADERVLRAFRFARDGVRITEGSDGGVYVRSGGQSPLRPGDQLVAVDGRSLLRMKYRDALDFLSTRGAELDVVVSRAVLGGGDVIPATPTGMRAVCCVLPNE